jgi:hypothetical protein
MVVKEIPRASKTAHPSTSRGDTNRKPKSAADAFHLACMALAEFPRPKGSSRGTGSWWRWCQDNRLFIHGSKGTCSPGHLMAPARAIRSHDQPDRSYAPSMYLTTFPCGPRARQSSTIMVGNLIVPTGAGHPYYAPPCLTQLLHLSRLP